MPSGLDGEISGLDGDTSGLGGETSGLRGETSASLSVANCEGDLLEMPIVALGL